jgi:hypothetical protein
LKLSKRAATIGSLPKRTVRLCTEATVDREAVNLLAVTLSHLRSPVTNLDKNISEEDVQTIVNDIVDDLNNLGTDDVETIVSNALSGLEKH